MSDDLIDRAKAAPREVDPLHVRGSDGEIRPLDEHYDSVGDVRQDPYGAWLGLQNLSTELEARDARVAELEAALRNIRELNMTGTDEDGHRWAHSDLIEQEIARAALEGEK